jgi:hypothetical protein
MYLTNMCKPFQAAGGLLVGLVTAAYTFAGHDGHDAPVPGCAQLCQMILSQYESAISVSQLGRNASQKSFGMCFPCFTHDAYPA